MIDALFVVQGLLVGVLLGWRHGAAEDEVELRRKVDCVEPGFASQNEAL